MGKKKFTAHEMQIAVDEIERLKKENAGLRQNVGCLDKQREINKNLIDENADLRRREKVAEDALGDMVEIVGNVIEYIGVDGGTMNKVENARAALAEIRALRALNDVIPNEEEASR